MICAFYTTQELDKNYQKTIVLPTINSSICINGTLQVSILENYKDLPYSSSVITKPIQSIKGELI